MANGNNWLTFFRVCIGLIVALLGSIAIDEVIFKDDINISVASIKETSIGDAKHDEYSNFNVLNNFASLDNNIVNAQTKYDNAVDVTLAEADGSKGTKARGIGSVTKLKEQKENERKAELNSLLTKKRNLTHTRDSVVNLAGVKAGMTFSEYALLTRIKALFHLVVEDRYMLCIYILFSLLMFFFEFLVVILKLTWKKTNYERKVEMIDEIGQRRMEYLMRKESPMIDPGYFLPHLEETRKVLNKNISIFSKY